MLVISFHFVYVKSAYAYAAEPFSEQDAVITPLSFNQAEHYLNIEQSSDFTIFEDFVILVKNNILNAYSLTQKTMTEQFLNLNNVTQILTQSNYLYVLSNNSLKIYNTEFEEVAILNSGNPIAVSAQAVAVMANENTVTIATMQNNVLSIMKTNHHLNLISHNSTTLLTVSEVLSLTVSESFAYVLHKLSNANVMLQIDVNSLQTQKSFVTEILDTTNMIFANLYDKNLILTISDAKKTLTVFEVNNENNQFTLTELVVKKNSIFTNPTFKLGQLSEITSVKVVNNNIYILDNMNASLQVFELLQNPQTEAFALTAKHVLLASSGYDLGRFHYAKHLNAVNKQQLIVTDTLNNRLQLVNNNQITALSGYTNNGTITELNQPQTALVTNELQLVVYNKALQGDEVLILTLDGKFVKSIQSFLFNDVSAPIVNLHSLTIDKQNNLYAIDAINNTLLVSQNYEEFTVLENEFTASNNFNSTSKIITTHNQQLVVYHNNYLHLISLQTGEILHSAPFEKPVKDLNADYNHVFVLTNQDITKLTITNNEFTQPVVATYESIPFNDISCFSIANDSGVLFLFNNKHQQIVKISHTEFSDGLANFVHPVNINQPVALTELVKLGTLTSDAFVFTYPAFEGENYKLLQHQTVFVLPQTTYNNFHVVLFSHSNKLKQGYISTNSVTITTPAPNTEDVALTTINKKVKIFKYPVLLPTDNNQSIYLQEVTLNTSLTPLTDRIESIDGSYYYAVALDGGAIGYVNSADAIYETTTPPTPLIKPNAKVFSLNGEVVVYASANTLSAVVGMLQSYTQVYIETYHKNSEFTKIIFLDENYNEVEGYILTHHVWRGNNEQQITAIILISVGLLLLGLTAFTYVKIKNKKKENN